MYRSELKTIEGAMKFARGSIKFRSTRSTINEVFNTLINEIERLNAQIDNLELELIDKDRMIQS